MEIKNKKILVTGGAGFIGSHLCERLLLEGAEVVVFDNFSTGKIDNLSDIKKSISLIKGDIVNDRLLEKAVKGCDVIVHQAFPYGKSGMGLKDQYIKEGIIGTFNILQSAVKNDIKKIIFASSVSVYGLAKYLPIDENHPVDPFLPYGATKRAGELYCSTFSKLYGIETASLRYFYIYGPRYSTFDHSAMVHFINSAIRNKPILIFGDGKQIRDYTYIDDAIDATLLAIKKDKKGSAVYNVSSGAPIKILDLAKKIKETTGNKVKIGFAKNNQYRYVPCCVVPIGMTTKKGGRWIDERNYTADLSLIKRELGYVSRISPEEGIARTIKWLNEKK